MSPKFPKDQNSSLPYDAQDDRELFEDTFSVASAGECTGLIPAAPAYSAEVDSYSEIYDIPLSRTPNRGKNQQRKETPDYIVSPDKKGTATKDTKKSPQ